MQDLDMIRHLTMQDFVHAFCMAALEAKAMKVHGVADISKLPEFESICNLKKVPIEFKILGLELDFEGTLLSFEKHMYALARQIAEKCIDEQTQAVFAEFRNQRKFFESAVQKSLDAYFGKKEEENEE